MFKNRLTKLLVCVLVNRHRGQWLRDVRDTVKEKRKIDYQTSRRLPPLEIFSTWTNLPAGKDSPIPGARSTATYPEFISDKKNTPGQTSGSCDSRCCFRHASRTRGAQPLVGGKGRAGRALAQGAPIRASATVC